MNSVQKKDLPKKQENVTRASLGVGVLLIKTISKIPLAPLQRKKNLPPGTNV